MPNELSAHPPGSRLVETPNAHGQRSCLEGSPRGHARSASLSRGPPAEGSSLEDPYRQRAHALLGSDPRQERTGTMRVFKAWKGIAALRRPHHLEEDPSPLAS